MMAARPAYLRWWRQLLSHKAQVDVSDPNYGQTALMFAARAGSCGNRFLRCSPWGKSQVATRLGETPAFIKPNSVAASASVWHSRGGVPADRGRREPTPGG